jgi:hypothetical protein
MLKKLVKRRDQPLTAPRKTPSWNDVTVKLRFKIYVSLYKSCQGLVDLHLSYLVFFGTSINF